MKNILIAICAFNFVFATAVRADITLTGSELAGATYSTPGPGANAQYISTGGGYAYITSPDNVAGPGLPTTTDTGLVTIDNGYDGVTLGTLSYLVGEGATGHVSFNNFAEGGNNNNYAFWVVALTDPNNSAVQVMINAFSDNTLGANPFNQGPAGGSSVDVSVSNPDQLVAFGTTWSTVGAIVDDGTDLGDWDVASVGVAVGGWDTDLASSAVINAITLPGDAVPEPSTYALLLTGCGLLAFWRSRRASAGIH